jgi:hypothetical protein
MSDGAELEVQVQSLGTSAFAQACFRGDLSPIVRLPPFANLAGGDLERRLREFLFPPATELDRLLQEAHRAAAGAGQALRIRLRVNETAEPASPDQLEEMGFRRSEASSYRSGLNWIAVLPWEWLGAALLNAPSPTAISVVREILPHGRRHDHLSPAAAPARGVDCELRLIAAWAEPRVEEQNPQFAKTFGGLQADWLAKTLTDRITAAGTYPAVYELPHATLEALAALVGEKRADIVHLVAHGETDADPRLGYGRVVLEDRDGHARAVDGETLGSALCSAGWRPQLVVLHVCQSATTTLRIAEGVAPALIRAGVPRVIGMQAELGTAEAADFSAEFFGELASSLSVERALLAIRGKLAAPGVERLGNPRLPSLLSTATLPGWAVPVLFMEPGATPVLRQGDLPPAVRWPADGKVMILVGAGNEPFYIDKYPVTRRDFESVVRGDTSPAAASALPVFAVQVAEAEGYARKTGKRLPTVTAWRLAAGGAGRSRYPWGEVFEPNRCNSKEYWQQTPRPQPVLAGLGDGPTPVTAFPPQTTAGICDLVGNVAELAHDDDGAWWRCGGSFTRGSDELRLDGDGLPRFFAPSIETGFRTIATVPELVAMAAQRRIDAAPTAGLDAGLELPASSLSH